MPWLFTVLLSLLYFLQYAVCTGSIANINTFSNAYILSCLVPILVISVLALTCGLRRGEILCLQWVDIDFKNKRLNITNNLIHVNNELILQDTKTSGSGRTVALPEIAIKALLEQKEKQEDFRIRGVLH